MKQKKIIVPILTLAVMLLMVGGVYAVFSSTQPEKSKAENVRDTTDQDYEKGLTEEQKAFNELINKQIYEETANNLELLASGDNRHSGSGEKGQFWSNEKRHLQIE